MSIELPEDLQQVVDRKVKSGAYRSAEEVMREALYLLIEHDAREERKLEALRRDIQEGLDDIERGAIHSWEEVEREMREIIESKHRRAG